MDLSNPYEPPRTQQVRLQFRRRSVLQGPLLCLGILLLIFSIAASCISVVPESQLALNRIVASFALIGLGCFCLSYYIYHRERRGL